VAGFAAALQAAKRGKSRTPAVGRGFFATAFQAALQIRFRAGSQSVPLPLLILVTSEFRTITSTTLLKCWNILIDMYE
jgi:hypothetical protein